MRHVHVAVSIAALFFLFCILAQSVHAAEINNPVILSGLTGMGRISVSSEPDGAYIYLDGADTGKKTPYTLKNVGTGIHEVYVTLPGYVTPDAKTVTVKNQKTSAVAFSLVRMPEISQGNISVTSSPAGTRVYLDDADTGKETPCTIEDLDAGIHEVYVTLSGYIPPEAEQVNVAGDTTTPVHFTLVALHDGGALKITSVPAGASIWINRRDTNQVTPFTFVKEPGDYEVDVKMECYTVPDPQMITVSPANPAAFKFVLQNDGTCPVSAPEFPFPAVPVAIMIICGAILLFCAGRIR